jgi:hypothetical protein
VNWTAALRKPARATDEPRSGWLVDDFVECYVCWREESAAVRSAYDRWATAEDADQELAYAAYVAALDREERAARTYGESAERMAA